MREGGGDTIWEDNVGLKLELEGLVFGWLVIQVGWDEGKVDNREGDKIREEVKLESNIPKDAPKS